MANPNQTRTPTPTYTHTNARQNRSTAPPAVGAATVATAEHAIFARRPIPDYCSISCSLATGKFLSIPCYCVRGCKDRISLVPDELLSNIVARLPVKDAARTATLSSRWSCIWASTRLLLDDADLLPALDDIGTDGRTIAHAGSCVLDSHPGPFRFVRLTYGCEYAAARDDGALLWKWIGVLVAKGVDELVLFNRIRPIAPGLPADVLRLLSSLRRLDLGNWDFPSTANLSCRAVFSNLRDLGLCQTGIGAADLDRIIRLSPNLDKLALVASDNSPPSVLIRSYRLRCVLFWKTVAQKVHVLATPMLERLILWKCTGARLGLFIGNAPKLEIVGYLDPRSHVLERCVPSVSPLPMVPSMKVLALKVRISVPEEANMVPVYLRCFPNVRTLHIMFDEVDEPSVKLKPDFMSWQEAGGIHCMLSTVEMVVLKNFRGDDLEF